MANLGSAVSNDFQIGVAELRLGTLANAGKLSQADSVGLIDEAAVKVSQTKVDLKGGFPRKVVKSAITEQLTTITAVLREYSRKNLSIMIGAGIPGASSSVATTITADVALNATDVVTTDSTGFSVGDIAVIYQEGKPETVSVVEITAVDLVAPTGLSFAANSMATALTAADGTIHVYKANQVAIGAVSKVNYFSATLIQQNDDGAPILWNFWKCSVGGDMDYKTSATDFGSSTMELSVLEPTAADVSVGGPLNAQAAKIAKHPMGMKV